MRNTRRLIYKYFYTYKAHKYLIHPSRPITDEMSMIDVNNLLNKANLTAEEYATICIYATKGHTPRPRNSKEFDNWLKALRKIHAVYSKIKDNKC